MFLKKVTLENFCGFARKYEADFAQFTVLVGPNNGGKTTLLRAIKFAIDAFRLYFGDAHEPNLGKAIVDWTIPLAVAGDRLGMLDLDLFYYARSRQAAASVTLEFEDGGNQVILNVTCEQGGSGNIRLTMHHNRNVVGGPRSVEQDAFLQRFHKVQAHFIPPLGTLSPTERELSWPNLQAELAHGRYSETWRNQLHWLNDGQPPELFQRVADVIRGYLGDVEVHPPRRTRQHTPPNVVVDYREKGVEYDISAGGGGLRTLVSLASVIQLSPASVLLFDEPDAHLHSSLQRQVTNLLLEQAGSGQQFIVSTHAPDVIDEVPIESLRWIDRTTNRSEVCDDIGKTLVRLGAVSHSQAIQFLGADVVLYFEAKPDRASLTALLKRCGKVALVKRARPAVLKGFGDTANLPGAMRLLKVLLPMRVAVAALRDADYINIDPKATVREEGDLLLLSLPCKELENLLITTPNTIASAAKRAADARANATGVAVPSPSPADVEAKIAEFTQASDVRAAIEDQWLFRWCELNGGLTDPGLLTEARKQFEQRWASLSWRRRCCPGKLVLTHIRRWLQGDPWKLTLTLPQLFAVLEPDPELQGLFDKLEEYVARVTA